MPATDPDARAAATMRRRLVGGIVASICALVLGVAWLLSPAADGHGTHMQLGMPVCGWVQAIGMPCPTCGMTTSFALAADGRLADSFVNQPAGALLALATAIGLLVGVHTALTGSVSHVLLGRLWRGWMWWAILAIGLGAWGWKIVTMKGLAG